MSTTPFRAAVIGLGVGGAHIDGYLRSPHSAIVAVCDTSPARLAERAAQYKIASERAFADYRTMLRVATPNIVSVCLPNALHLDATIASLEAGAHVLCEKPLATNTADAKKMLDAAKANHRELMVCYNHRYRADVQWIKRMVSEGKLGDIYHAYAWWRRETGIPGSGWFSQKEMSGGGALIDIGVHMLDMSLWLLGFPKAETVSANVTSNFGGRGLKVWGSPRWMNDANADKFDVDDSAVGFIRLAGGKTINLHASWAEHAQPGQDLIHLELHGTEGTVVLHVPNYVKEDTLRFYTEVGGTAVTISPKVRWGLYSHEALIVDVLEALVNGHPLPTEATQGLQAVEILEGMYQSSQTRREVVFG
ncbi:MAG: Gfo/Idh/MocA family oxidoreductase [Anaerolineae bacterium]